MSRGFKIAVAAILAIMLIGFIVALQTVDVAAVGPQGTSIGLSKWNKAVADTLGFHEDWYKITTVLGVIPFAVCGVFALIGVVQWVKRKSIRKVDPKLFWLAGLYAVTAILYVLFDKVAINYRPVIMPGEAAVEPSFPSSHTLAAIVVFGSAILMISDYIRSRGLAIVLCVACWLVMVATVLGRLYSGVHWITDIICGILLGTFLITIFEICTERLPRIKR